VNELIPFGLPEGYKTNDILDFTSQRTMVGLLEQLCLLSQQTMDIFMDLRNDSNLTLKRIVRLHARVAAISSQLPALDQKQDALSLETMYVTPASGWHDPGREDSSLLREETRTESLKCFCEAANPPPELEIMDPLMETPGDHALSHYTDPGFFANQWAEEQRRLREEARKARKARKEQRKKDREKEQDKQSKPKAVARIQRYRYDPLTGEKIAIYADGTPVPVESTAPSAPRSFALSSGDSSIGALPPDLPTTEAPTAPAPIAPAAPAPVSPASPRAPAAPAAPVAPPAPPAPGAPPAPPAPPAPGAPPAPPAPPAPGAPPAPPAPPAPGAPPPPPAPGAPPPPPAPGMMGGGGPVDMASMLAGAKLKHTGGPEKKVEAQSDLMAMIRQGKQLKSAKERVLAAAPQKSSGGGLNVAEILARRIAVADSDDEDDDDDDEWDD